MKHRGKNALKKLIYLVVSVVVIACAPLPPPINQTNIPHAIPTNLTPAEFKATSLSHRVFAMPPSGEDLIGNLYSVPVNPSEKITAISSFYGIAPKALYIANPGLDPEHMMVGATLVIPSEYILPPANEREGLVINIPELRVYYFTGNQVMVFPVGLGEEGWHTPISVSEIVRKQHNPTWNPPASVRAQMASIGAPYNPSMSIPGGPNNPLGHYALYPNIPGQLIRIHGTDAEQSIGQLVSHGCIRMYNNDIEMLFNTVPLHTKVSVIYAPDKVGIRGNTIYLEAHEPIEQSEYQSNIVPVPVLIQSLVGTRKAQIDWNAVKNVLAEQAGTPVAIGTLQ
jgi:L,D-transpeptidase ErfK/SrfK